MKIDSFVVAILLVVGLAYVYPNPAEILPLDTIASVGISMVFLFYGLKLSPEKIKSGLKNWKLHLLVQAATFLLFPLLVLAIKPIFEVTLNQDMWLGMFFLAALPSTVSSSVVMVSMANGNMPAAIFNASISGLIGIAVTPLWMSLFVTGGTGDVSQIYLGLITEILVPIVIGLLLQRWAGKFVQKYSKAFSQFDRAVILVVIYKSFTHSFESHVFSTLEWFDLLILSLWVLALFFGVYLLISVLCKALKFNREDTVTALFCGTKKSLVHGTVFSKVIFGNLSTIGIILLPIMLFHAFQILIISTIANGKIKGQN